MHMGPGPVHDPMGGYGALSPAQDQHQQGGNLMGSGLPPMSTFQNARGGPIGPSHVAVAPGANALGQATASPLYNHSPNLGPGPHGAAGSGGTEIRDALGKALASVRWLKCKKQLLTFVYEVEFTRTDLLCGSERQQFQFASDDARFFSASADVGQPVAVGRSSGAGSVGRRGQHGAVPLRRS